VQGVLASGGEDHLVVVWSLERAGAAAAAAAAAGSKAGKDATPPEVLFKHVGHRAGVSATVTAVDVNAAAAAAMASACICRSCNVCNETPQCLAAKSSDCLLRSRTAGAVRPCGAPGRAFVGVTLAVNDAIAAAAALVAAACIGAGCACE
jgi:hypothetical protein